MDNIILFGIVLYLIGVILGILMTKVLFKEVTGQDLFVMLIFGGILGPFTFAILLVLAIIFRWKTKIF